MTWARKSFYLSSSLVLAGAMSFAQNTPGAMPPGMGSSMPGQDNATSEQSSGATLRGCLSGSSDNYTLTDHSGSIYHLVGGGSDLQNSVGHEVEITGAPDARRTGVPDSTAANTASSYQVAAVRDIASTCDRGGVSSGATGSSKRDHDPQPMNEMPPTTDSHPKGSSGEAVPPHDNESPRPQPQGTEPPHTQMMASLQDPASQDPGSSTPQNSNTPTPAPGASVSTPASDMSQPAQTASPAQQQPSATGSPATPPPVTDQTPAAAQSPTSPNSQLGTSSASPTATPADPTATSPTSPDGTQPAAAQPSPGAVPATPNSGSPQAATPQSTQDDANKPLYARPATDVPWARHPDSTTTTTTTPEGSTTTTTTTPHQ